MRALGVVRLPSDSKHDIESVEAIARRLALLCGCEVAETRTQFPLGDTYFIPTFALSRDRLGDDFPIDNFLGGIVDYEFMTTKLITHPALDTEQNLPEGWVQACANDLKDDVLWGYSVFSKQSALDAGVLMLRKGKVRIKKPYLNAGKGQFLISSTEDLSAFIERLPEDEFSSGLVFEENIELPKTYSVGSIRFSEIEASYVGRQYEAPGPHGEMLYAGSRLFVVRGGWSELVTRLATTRYRPIIDAAIRYDNAAERYLNLVASRKNYDVLVGPATSEGTRFGVLEQSWRVGGATPAEVRAIEALSREPQVAAVQAVVREQYVPQPPFQDDDFIVYSGFNDSGHLLHKYARIEKLHYD